MFYSISIGHTFYRNKLTGNRHAKGVMHFNTSSVYQLLKTKNTKINCNFL